MKKEVDEDVYLAIKNMAQKINLGSRNYNDELIAIDYYKNLYALTPKQLEELIYLWQQKAKKCYKEMLASRWMVIQILGIIVIIIYIAWLSAGQIGAVISGVLGIIPTMTILQDRRPSRARHNWQDAHKIHQHLVSFKAQNPAD